MNLLCTIAYSALANSVQSMSPCGEECIYKMNPITMAEMTCDSERKLTNGKN